MHVYSYRADSSVHGLAELSWVCRQCVHIDSQTVPHVQLRYKTFSKMLEKLQVCVSILNYINAQMYVHVHKYVSNTVVFCRVKVKGLYRSM